MSGVATSALSLVFGNAKCLKPKGAKCLVDVPEVDVE